MVTRPAKREVARTLVGNYGVSESHACRVIDFPLSTFRYRSCLQEDEAVINSLKYWAEKRPRYGHPRLHEMVRRDGHMVNHKKTERLYYKTLKLGLRRKKPKRKYRCETRSPIGAPVSPNEIWSMDFVSDQLICGKRIRGLTIIDIFSRYNHAIELDSSLTGRRVVETLDRICTFEGYPKIITVDNGPEFICMALDKWAYKHSVKLKFSRPGKPTDNPFIESFNGKMRDEFLDMHWFRDLSHARTEAEKWRVEYNELRPHSSIGMMTPMEYLEKHNNEKVLDLIV